ncbi:hypothetical protein EV121DRAFT_297762 [Schizophyllum commune]|nr:hypothetical protein K525DRAFT_275650 [Schizophyllum commune Loenen D]
MVCVDYDDIGETKERKILQSFQMRVALMPFENLAVNTHRSRFIRTLNDKVSRE